MIRFYNGRLLRFGGGMRVTVEELWTEGGTIAYVGPTPAGLTAVWNITAPCKSIPYSSKRFSSANCIIFGNTASRPV